MVSVEKKYKNVVVNKPWGYEYLAYENEHVGLWFLHIEKDHQTSFHCHPKKDTGLIVLDGSVDVSFFNDINRLISGRKIMIRKGLFHSTKALSDGGANIFEIETPKIKHDLVRLEDSYGREGKKYESSSHHLPKNNSCVWLDEASLSPKHLDVCGCCIQHIEIIDKKGADFIALE